MARVRTNRIKLRTSLQDVQDKLQQQIAEGDTVRSRPGVTSWITLQELRGERRLWVEYTAEVLKALFEATDYARDFDLEGTPVSRNGGSIDQFAFDERAAILAGTTFLRSLHKRLPLIAGQSPRPSLGSRVGKKSSEKNPQVRATTRLLEKVHPELASSYKQVLRDLEDVTRLSYRGTANELREILREVLARLAPDDEVASQSWFVSSGNKGDEAKRPTHQQRARYILERKGAGSRVHDVAEGSLQQVDEGLSKLVRDMYSRTSVASHTAQDLQEIKKEVMYFDGLIHDLCG
jgi:hypothetical protein